MSIERYGTWTAMLLLGCAAGCAGNGDGLNSNGEPLTPGGGTSATVTADFQSIQDNVFTPICSKCHIGASAPEGLQLDAAHSYNLLVGVPSTEQPSVLRVDPGSPANSYMIRKIMDTPGISGAQMPFMEQPLVSATQTAMAQWVTNGAPNAPAAAAASQVLAVQTTAPLDQTDMEAAPANVVVTFTKDVDSSLVNDTTVMLEGMGTAGAAAPSDAASGSDAAPAATRIAARVALAQSNAAVLLITPAAALKPGVYRVTVRGTGAGALADMNAVPLGTDLSFEFTVGPAQ
jgi:methionine-rich copper-binding protein CopC